MQTTLDQWHQDKAGDEDDEEEDYPPVEMQQIIFVLTIVPFGLIMSFIILILESIHKLFIHNIFFK